MVGLMRLIVTFIHGAKLLVSVGARQFNFSTSRMAVEVVNLVGEAETDKMTTGGGRCSTMTDKLSWHQFSVTYIPLIPSQDAAKEAGS